MKSPAETLNQLLLANNLKITNVKLNDPVIRKIEGGAMIIEAPGVQSIDVDWIDPNLSDSDIISGGQGSTEGSTSAPQNN